MQKTIEDVKNEFNERLITVGNKSHAVLIAIVCVLSWIGYIIALFAEISFDRRKHFSFIIFTITFLMVLLFNYKTKWKSKCFKYAIFLAIFLSGIELYFSADSDNLLFIFTCLASSIVYLDSKFVLKTGAMIFITLFSVTSLRALVDKQELMLIMWNYYFSFFIIITFTIFFSLATKLIRKLVESEVLDEYEIKKAKKDSALANKIQDGFLKHEFPSNENFEINACMIPSKDVGGDFYDFYMIDKTRLAMIVADVSGKGMPAALLMANAKTVIKDYLTYGMSFEKSMETANREIMHENKEMQFITLFVCIVDLLSGKMNYINAGHVKPYIVSADGNVETIMSKPDFIFGVRKDTRYHSNEALLKPGDRLFLCTDGVTERLDVNNKLFGKERLIDVLNKNAKSKTTDIIPNVLMALEKFGKDKEQNDDITCLTFEYKKGLILDPAVIKDFDVGKDKTVDIITYIKDVLVKKAVPDKVIGLMAVASDEIISNVSKYAYEEASSEKNLNINIQVDNGFIEIVYTDQGKYFNPLSKITLSGTTKVTDKSKIGGLGIQLTWNIMDMVLYNRIGDKNVIRIQKEF